MLAVQLMKAIPLTLIVTGCATGVPDMTTEVPKPVVRRVRKMFFGVPVLAGMEGSYAVLDNRWALTVAHNDLILMAQFKEYYKHPHCDIALFRHDSDSEQVKMGLVYKDKPVYLSGYPMGLPLAYNQGEYIGDVNMTDRPNCLQSLTDASIMKGMSGGPAWNDNGELVGINVGWTSLVTWPDGSTTKEPALFQSVYAVKDWIYEITGKDYFANKEH